MCVPREFPQVLVPGMLYFILSQDPETLENWSIFLFVFIAGKLQCIFTILSISLRTQVLTLCHSNLMLSLTNISPIVFLKLHILELKKGKEGNLPVSVLRACDSWSRGWEFKPHTGCIDYLKNKIFWKRKEKERTRKKKS